MRLVFQRALFPALALTAAVASVSFAAPVVLKWPPWISIESPVNPADPSTRGAVLLIHAITHAGTPSVREVSATAEGLVNGTRRSIPLQLGTTSRPGVFSVQRQWPAEGTWLVRVAFSSTTALVSIDKDGVPGRTIVPTAGAANAPMPIPRRVSASEIDEMLSKASRQ